MQSFMFYYDKGNQKWNWWQAELANCRNKVDYQGTLDREVRHSHLATADIMAARGVKGHHLATTSSLAPNNKIESYIELSVNCFYSLQKTNGHACLLHYRLAAVLWDPFLRALASRGANLQVH